MGMIAGASIFSGCAINPVTGKTQFMLMSESQEIGMGNEAHGQIVAQYGSYTDDNLQGWFTERGTAMAKITERPRLPWHFTVLDSPVINAFAVPGGYIYITRGILAYFNNEAQFAGVLAHELGHVNARHTAARYSKSQLANIGLTLGSAISEEFAQFAQFASLGTTLLFLKFSRDDEREADRLSVKYSSEAGYDARQVSEFFKTLERLSPGGGSLPAWQSTHPDPGDRVNDTRKQAQAFQASHTNMTFNLNREEYLNRIDGIVYGDDPRQGYVKDNVFYHPVMAFQFPIPNGWAVSNMPTEVRMAPENQSALLVFTTAPGTDIRTVSTAFASQNNITVTSSTNITVNGMSGVKTVGQMPMENQTAGIASYYILKDNNIFMFHGLSSAQQFSSNDSLFNVSATGFNRVSDRSRLDVSPKHITVRRTASAGTLRSALNGFGVPESEIDNLAIINALDLDSAVPAGVRLKVIAET